MGIYRDAPDQQDICGTAWGSFRQSATTSITARSTASPRTAAGRRIASSVPSWAARPLLTRQRGSSGSLEPAPFLNGSAGPSNACQPTLLLGGISAAGRWDDGKCGAGDLVSQSGPGEDPFVSIVIARVVMNDDLHMLAGGEDAVGWSESDWGTVRSRHVRDGGPLQRRTSIRRVTDNLPACRNRVAVRRCGVSRGASERRPDRKPRCACSHGRSGGRPRAKCNS